MNAVFTGRRRSGKTTLAFYKAQRNGGGIIVFDPKREFRGWPDTFSTVEEVDDAAKRKHAPTVIVFHPQGDSDEEFTLLGEWVIQQHEIAMAKDWDKKGFHFTLLVDEAHNIQGPNWTNPKLLQILSQNRPEILDVFLTVQSPKDAFNRIKSRISDWYIFSTNLPSDLEYIHKELGVSRKDAERITTLGDHEYAHFYFDGGQPVAEFVTNGDWFTPLELTKEEAKEMAKEDREERGHEQRYPVQIESQSELFSAYDRVNRRKADDPKTKYRGRKSDREQQRDERGESGRKKPYSIGDWDKEKSA
jgi:hypothetical protein